MDEALSKVVLQLPPDVIANRKFSNKKQRGHVLLRIKDFLRSLEQKKPGAHEVMVGTKASYRRLSKMVLWGSPLGD